MKFCFFKAISILVSSLVLIVNLSCKSRIFNSKVKTEIQLNDISYQSFLKALKEQNPKNIDEFIAKNSSFFKSYTLIYSPRGSQKGSFDFPRVVASNLDGSFLASFNSTFPGNKSIEIIHFDKQNSVFKPATISFENNSYSVNESESKCASCHGSGADFRPNWDPYPYWPGTYGSTHAIFGFSKTGGSKMSAEGVKGYLWNYELEKLEAFKNKVQENRTSLNPNTELLRYSHLARIEEVSLETFSMRNTELSKSLQKLNFQRILKQIENSASLKNQNGFKVVSCFVNATQSTEKSISPEILRSLQLSEKMSLDIMASEVVQRIEQEVQEIVDRFNFSLLLPYMKTKESWGDANEKVTEQDLRARRINFIKEGTLSVIRIFALAKEYGIDTRFWSLGNTHTLPPFEGANISQNFPNIVPKPGGITFSSGIHSGFTDFLGVYTEVYMPKIPKELMGKFWEAPKEMCLAP